MSGQGDVAQKDQQFVLALDVGSSTVRSIIFNQHVKVCGEESVSIRVEYPKPGWLEIRPDVLWEQVVHVIKTSVQKANISPSQIKAMSISTQRCAFLCWDTNNNDNEPLHNIISWKDLRAAQLVTDWNNSFYFKSFRRICKILYTLTRKKRYLAGSVLKVMNEQVVMRLIWVLQNVPGIREKIAMNQVKFGTLDTFLIHKLTYGEYHVTDYTCASATGFFDPFVLHWADWALKMFSIPSSILPKLVPSAGEHFGECRIFPGHSIPILSSMADQSSSLFGSTSFHPGNVKMTLGTGAFLNVNTGAKPHTSVAGIYPLVAWKYGSELVYMAEGGSKDNGTIVDWGKTIGLYNHVSESSAIASSVPDSHGVYFVPAFNGLQAPYNDAKIPAGFIGFKHTTKRAHLVRAILESLAFRVHQLLNVMQTEADISFDWIRVDGGVSRNDFILQTIADLTGKRVERPAHVEMSALGCAFLAGMRAGIWASKYELEKFYRIEKVFLPKVENEESIQHSFIEWERAIEKFSSK